MFLSPFRIIVACIAFLLTSLSETNYTRSIWAESYFHKDPHVAVLVARCVIFPPLVFFLISNLSDGYQHQICL